MNLHPTAGKSLLPTNRTFVFEFPYFSTGTARVSKFRGSVGNVWNKKLMSYPRGGEGGEGGRWREERAREREREREGGRGREGEEKKNVGKRNGMADK